MPLTEEQTAELHKCMLAYFKENNFKESYAALKEEVKLQPVSKRNMLATKWKSITKLTKKIQDLEASKTQLEQDCSAMQQAPGKRDRSELTPRIPALHCLTGHHDPVTCVKFHPKFGVLATAGEDAAIKVWDAEGGMEDFTMMGHQDAVQHISFNPKGTTLVSCSADLTIRLWDLESHSCTKTMNSDKKSHTHNISCAVFSNDGKKVISCSRDNLIIIWSVATGVPEKTLKGHTEWVRAVAVAPTGSMLASCACDKTVKLWDMETGECTKTLQGHSGFVQAVCFSNPEADATIIDKFLKGKRRTDMMAKLFAEKGGDEKKTSNGGMFVASASRDKTVRLWCCEDGELVHTFSGHTNWVQGLCFQPHGKFLVSASDDKSIRVWDLATGECGKELMNAHDTFVVSIDWPKNLPLFASGACDKQIKIWQCG